jgi:glycine/D-amino acid oxidase-like deaminating enzyme
MDLTSSHPLWSMLDGLPHAYPRLHADARADVVIIGGGVTGALVAHALVGAGFDTIVVDKREIGWGSTAASTALLQYELDVPLVELRDTIGREHADRSYLACCDAIERLAAIVATLPDDVGFRRSESVYLTAHRRDVRAQSKELEARREIGLAVEWAGRDELRARYGIRDRAGAVVSAVGAEVDAYALAHSLFAAAVRSGARVFARTNVESVEPSAGGVTVAVEGGATLSARHAVFASGYETRDFLGRRSPAKLVSTFAVASEPGTVPRQWEDHPAVMWERARPYLYLRRTPEGRVIIGGEDERFRSPHHRDALVVRKAKRLVERYRELFGDDARFDAAFAWAGTFGETKDGLPFIGAHSKWPSCQFALGYGGNGITFSVIAAEVIRDALLGRANPLAELFRFDR